MTQQDLVATICQQTGISRKDLAYWIGTDPSVLCRYVTGTRSLPLKAMQQLLFLHQLLSDLPPLPPATPEFIVEAGYWQALANECSERLTSLQNRYKAMLENYAAAAKALQLLTALALDTVMLTPKKERWIAEQQYQAEKLAADNDLVVQYQLWMQITLVQTELEVYNGLLKSEAEHAL